MRNRLLTFPQVVGFVIVHKLTELKFLLSFSKQFAGASNTSGLYKHSCPSRWGFVFLHSANPHLPPPQPIYVVVGLYIDPCIIISVAILTIKFSILNV